ncbi:hypothetical protein C2S53_014968 [Perilla frutescens var. hirtella]|uniref:Pentatricopeptide repeat-containing protein n=1 Tax=Perilla frutescens var. hirtella TaxID=608512 RepID=A0AAD4J6R3_PERFH|nr:hypothetical protein C2S53_014968 [Perilla frutescens var. hirtella]
METVDMESGKSVAFALFGGGIALVFSLGKWYAKRRHFVAWSSPSQDEKIGERKCEEMKKLFKEKVLPPLHPERVRVRRIAQDLINTIISFPGGKFVIFMEMLNSCGEDDDAEIARLISPENCIVRLIHSCKNIRQLNQTHSHIIVSPNLTADDRSFLISRLLFHLCTASESTASLKYANKIFDHIAKLSLYIYNALIRANATKIKEPTSCEYFTLYKDMIGGGLVPDCVTLPFLLKECSKRFEGYMGRAIHVHIVKFGYKDCGVLEDAGKVFDGMSNRDVVSWNSMIVGCLRNGKLDAALELFREMKERKNIITWNSVITGLVQGGRAKEALDIFHEMQNSTDEENVVHLDKVTLASALSGCVSLGAIDHRKWVVHSFLERSEVEYDMVIGTALVNMYGECGNIERALEVFNQMRLGVRPNAGTFLGLLSACAHSGLVEKGRGCFDKMKRDYYIEPQVQHYACMIDILGRAGLFTEAEDLISCMPMRPDVFVWGALLGDCQLHGNVQLGERVAKFDDQKRIRSLMKGQNVRKTVPGSSMIEVDGVVHEFSVKGSSRMPIAALESVLLLLCNEMKIEGNDSLDLPGQLMLKVVYRRHIRVNWRSLNVDKVSCPQLHREMCKTDVSLS